MRSTLWLPIALLIIVVIIIGGIVILPTPETFQTEKPLIEDLKNPELVTGDSENNQTSTSSQQNTVDQQNAESVAEENVMVAEPLDNSQPTIPPSEENEFSENESIGGMVTPAAEDEEPRAINSIQGRVQNSNGDPVSGAQINVENHQPVQSTVEGLFTIDSIEQDQVSVRVEKEGYQTLTQNVSVGSIDVILVLVQEGSLAGRVVDQKNEPVSFAEVSIQASQGIWAKNIKTGRDGRFEVVNAPDATLSLKAQLKGFEETPESSKVIESPAATLVTLVLKRPMFYISGRVINRSDQTGVPNFSLHLKPENSSTVGEQTTQTDGTGTYRFEDLQRGTYLVSSLPEENASRNLVVPLDDDFKTVRIYENSANNVNFEVVEGREITGVVSTSGGQPVSNAEVSVSKLGAPTTMTQSDGFYRLSGVPVRSVPGTESRTDLQIQIMASHPQYGNGLSEPLPSNQAAQINNVNITLKGVSTLRGNVVDQSDNPVPNANVNLTNLLTNEELNATSDGSGNFVFEQVSVADQPGLLQGTHLIQATKENMGLAKKEIVISSGEEKFVTLTMQSGGSIQGFVSDSEGTPLPGTIVKTWLPTGGNVTAVADENGFYELSSLPNGEYDVAFRFDGEPPLSAHLYRVQPNNSNANAVLQPDEWIITGTVTNNQTGEPIHKYDFHLEANPSDPNARPYSMSKSVNTPDGTYQVTVYEPGRYLITFYSEGYNPIQGSVRVSPNYRNRQFLNLKMTPTEQYGGIRGTLAPTAGTHLVAVGISGKDIVPTNGNSFTITDVPAGSNYLYFYVSDEPGGVGSQMAGALHVNIRPDQITNLGTFDAQQLKTTRN